MNELSNELINRIYYLSPLVSYPLCDSLIGLTCDPGSIKTLMDGLDSLIDSDLNMAYLLFQMIMAMTFNEIPAQINELRSHKTALRQFLCEFYLDLEDYYEQAQVECDE